MEDKEKKYLPLLVLLSMFFVLAYVELIDRHFNSIQYVLTFFLLFGIIILSKDILVAKTKHKFKYDKVPKYEIWEDIETTIIDPIAIGYVTKRKKISLNNILSILLLLAEKKIVNIEILGNEYYISLKNIEKIKDLKTYENTILRIFMGKLEKNKKVNLKERLTYLNKQYEYKILLKQLYKDIERDIKKKYFRPLSKVVERKTGIISYVIYYIISSLLIYGCIPIIVAFKMPIILVTIINLILYMILIGIYIYEQIAIIVNPNYFKELNKLYGVSKYLIEYSSISEKEMKYVKLYEKYYIYAINLNIAEKFNKEFNQRIFDSSIILNLQLLLGKEE